MDEQIKPVAWRAKTPHGWIVGKTQHSSCDEPLYSQQSIDALRAERDLFRDETIELVRQNGEWQARAERLAEALDIIARVGKASRNKTTRTLWIVARAISALNGDEDWQALPKPKGFHDALLHPTAAQENDDA